MRWRLPIRATMLKSRPAAAALTAKTSEHYTWGLQEETARLTLLV